MRPSIRKMIGAFGLLALFFVWGLLSLGAAYFALNSEDWMVRGAFYVIAGAGWLPFAIPIVTFMARRN